MEPANNDYHKVLEKNLAILYNKKSGLLKSAFLYSIIAKKITPLWVLLLFIF